LPDSSPTAAQRAASRIARLLRDNHVDVATAVILGAFIVLRLWATLGSPITAYPDSPSYFDFELWGGVRFPVITFVYAAVEDHRAVVTIQAILGALCWSLAAVIAGALVVPRAIRYGFQVALLLLGLTLPMTRFDNALLSESLSISIAVVLAALFLRLVCRPSTRLAVLVYVVAAAWALTRQSNAQLLFVAAIAVLALGVWGAHRRMSLVLAAGFVLLALLGALLASSTNQIEQYNTAQILVRRVIDNPERNAWFREQGMPNGQRAIERQRELSGDENFDSIIALQTDPIFGQWLLADGPDTYFRYLVSHPGFVVSTPFTDNEAYRGFLQGVTAYGSSRRVVPEFVDTIFWPETETERTFMQLYVGFGLLAVVGRAVFDRRARRPAYAGFAVLLVSLSNIYFVTHLAGLEYARLMLHTAAVGRLAILWLFATGLGDADVLDPAADRTVTVSA
jgi:hypothetical protein